MRFLTWAKERFPFLNVTTAFVMAVAAKFAATPPNEYIWSWLDLLCGLMVLCHLFILRVLDEHKDFESDRIYHPERVLQRGLITLNEIRNYGWIAFIVEILCFTALRPQVIAITSFVIVWGWTFLMFKEFGVREWLRARIFLYSFLHLLISPLIFWSVFTIYEPQSWGNQTLFALLILSLGTGFLYELTRKNRGKEEDQKGELSFSSRYGYPRVRLFILIAALVSVFAGYFYLPKEGIALYLYCIGSLLIFLLLAAALKKFETDPTLKRRKANEGVAALMAIWVMLFPLINFAIQTQHSWRGFP